MLTSHSSQPWQAIRIRPSTITKGTQVVAHFDSERATSKNLSRVTLAPGSDPGAADFSLDVSFLNFEDCPHVRQKRVSPNQIFKPIIQASVQVYQINLMYLRVEVENSQKLTFQDLASFSHPLQINSMKTSI